jgi:hypothetical protein
MFDSNRIVTTSPAADFGGGGEWLEGASLASVGDRFSRNSIPGSEGSNWSWGGGLGILNTNCNAATPTESTLENVVVAGNSLGAGSAGDLAGAGIYVGCSPSTTHPNHLTLLDSTVTENRVGAGGIAGVGGNPGDQLMLANSIVAADSGGEELGGFTGAGGSLSATFSDVCGPGGSPLPGTGDICADPLLADDGNPASFDVRETPASPTVDAGSNALVPAGLATDRYGSPRIQAARSFLPPCNGAGSVGYTIGPAVVDMGAGELGPQPVPAIAILCPVRPPSASSFVFPALHQRTAGALVLAFRGLAAGHVTALATFRLTRTVVHTVKGRRHRTRRTETVAYGHAAQTTSVAGDVALALKPTRRALGLLRRRHRLKLTLTITFVQPGLLPSVQTRAVSVRYVARHRGR